MLFSTFTRFTHGVTWPEGTGGKLKGAPESDEPDVEGELVEEGGLTRLRLQIIRMSNRSV